MSQEKVDKYKQEKKNRKNPKKISKIKKIKKIIPYFIATIVVVLIVGYLGISIAKETGLYNPPTEGRTWSDEEAQSFRQVLIQNTDPNVQYTTVAPETTKKAK